MVSCFKLWFFYLHIFGIVGCIFKYLFCFTFICNNLMHLHLILSQQRQLIHPTKNKLAPSLSIQLELSKLQ